MADSIRVLFLNILRHNTHMGFIVAVIFKSVDRQTVIRVADTLGIMLKTFVREQPAGLLCGRRRARQRTCTHRNVRQELGDLERIPTLLQELLVLSRKIGLLGLLLDLTSLKLGLCTLDASSLCRSAKTRNLLPGLHTASQISRLNTLLTSSCLYSLTVSL